MNEIIILTGGSSGIGLATVRELRSRGCRVYELSRRAVPEDPFHISVDITDDKAVKAAVDDVVRREGRVDALVNNAGCGISGAVEFTDPADSHQLMEVNLFGMDNAVRAVLPHMRAAGQGRIVSVSSVAGVFAIPFQAWYSASKAAVLAMTVALANEVAPYGISVCDVAPGDIRTGFTAARQKNAAGDDAYGGRISRSVARMEHDEQTGMAPEAAGRFIAGIVLKKRVKPHYTIGFSYKLLVFLDRLLPGSVVRWLLYLLYAR